MSVLKRGNSKYWYIQFQFKGKTHIRSSKTTDKRVAEQMEREMRRQLHAQTYLGQLERMSIREALKQFRESKKGTPNHPTLGFHEKVVNRLLRTNRYIDELTSEDLERFKRDRVKEGVGPQTIKHNFNTVRGAWKFAKRMGYQVSDIEFPQIKLPKPRLRYLSTDEEKRLLTELNPKREGTGLKPWNERSPEMKRHQQDAYDLVVLLLDTGARYSEIANLGWSQVDLGERVIRLWRPKVQNESILYMTDRAYRVLARRQRGSGGDHVFTNSRGEQRGYSTQAIRTAYRRAGIHDCSVHTLRHTHATRLIQNGMSIYEVKEILGHSDIKTTMRYAHLEQKDVSSRARDVINKLNKQLEKPELKIV